MTQEKDEVKILLIDDDEDEFIQIRDLLAELPGGEKKYDLHWKSSYDGGLQALRTDSFDVCLLDYRLGALSGLDLLQESQNLSLEVPFILLTGHADLEVDMEALRAGAADFLVKNQLTAPLLDRAIRYSRKHAYDLKRLSEQAESFKTLFNSTVEGILVHREGVIMDSNAGACEIFGYRPEQLVGMPLSRLLQPEEQDHFQDYISSPPKRRVEFHGRKANEDEVFLEISSRPVVLRGQTVSLMAVRDLTERKQMEAQILQQDRLASLGLLASSLAHEIGNPLGVMRGRAEMCMEQSQDEVKADLGIIVGQIDRISKLVRSLLQVARGSQTEASATAIDVLPVLDSVLDLIKHEIERKGIQLEVKISGFHMMVAEEGPLSQVFLNLLVNSVHAIGEACTQGRNSSHKIQIQIEDKQAYSEIKISDTGCGISEKNLSQLFKPFFTTKAVGIGTGLGLATSYKLIQSWGGSIAAQSKWGEGTSFSIQLKRAVGSDLRQVPTH